jgi:hypothetical protein
MPMPWCVSPRTNINNASSGAWRHAPGLSHLLRTLTTAKDDNHFIFDLKADHLYLYQQIN